VKAKSPAYSWYPRDYTSDALVVSMTLEQEGAYRRLLDVEWLEGGLPDDPDQLWRLAKAPNRVYFEAKIWPTVRKKFVEKPRALHRVLKDAPRGLLINRRLERERAKQNKVHRQKQLAAQWRWHKERCMCSKDASCLQCLAFASALAGIKSSTSSTSSDRAPRSRPVENSKPQNPNQGTVRLYRKIAHEARERSRTIDQSEAISNVAEHFKLLCAQRRLDYDAQIASEAIEAVMRKP